MKVFMLLFALVASVGVTATLCGWKAPAETVQFAAFVGASGAYYQLSRGPNGRK